MAGLIDRIAIGDAGKKDRGERAGGEKKTFHGSGPEDAMQNENGGRDVWFRAAARRFTFA